MRAAGVYFAILTGLPWVAVLLLFATLVPRLEPMLTHASFRGKVPAVTVAAVAVSHALQPVRLPLGALALAAVPWLAVRCIRAKSRRVIVATIISGCLSFAAFLALALLIFGGLYYVMSVVAGRTPAFH
jgi:hypothetical protein